ncbi:hypothetical protein C9993_08305 [Marinobacter sp. Z-F4-2]|nr:hypothetical protein C9993_08305 [Marinobacter sp. Z-F4-2]
MTIRIAGSDAGTTEWLKDLATRLEALQKVNPAIREEEIDFFRDQFEAAKEAIGHASLALEGIRVIVTA